MGAEWSPTERETSWPFRRRRAGTPWFVSGGEQPAKPSAEPNSTPRTGKRKCRGDDGRKFGGSCSCSGLQRTNCPIGFFRDAAKTVLLFCSREQHLAQWCPVQGDSPEPAVHRGHEGCHFAGIGGQPQRRATGTSLYATCVYPPYRMLTLCSVQPHTGPRK